MSATFLQIDEVTKRIVGGNASRLNLYHPFSETFDIQIVRTSRFGLNITVQDKTDCALRIRLTGKPNAISTDGITPVIYAEADTSQFAWDATNEWFTGALNLDTATLRTRIGDKSGIDLYFEVLLTEDGEEMVIYGPVKDTSNVTVNATSLSPAAAGSAPTPAEDYYTETESDQRYMRTLPPNANYRFKDGMFQLWSDYYYSLDNTKPWYAPIFDTADGPRASGPIAD